MNEKLRQFLVPIATIGVIFVNYLAATGKINNISPEVISNKYPTIITPAGYAFAIWSLIYLGVITFSIYQSFPAQRENSNFRKIRTIFILNCAANCAWIYLWHYEMIIAALGVMFVLLGTLVLINLKLKSAETAGEIWFAKIPFSIYFGWVTAATILNFSIALVYLGFRPTGTTEQVIGALMLVVAVFLGVFIRLKLKLFAYPLVIAWALTAIAVNHGGATIIVVTCAIGVIILLLTSVSFVLNMKSSTT